MNYYCESVMTILTKQTPIKKAFRQDIARSHYLIVLLFYGYF